MNNNFSIKKLKNDLEKIREEEKGTVFSMIFSEPIEKSLQELLVLRKNRIDFMKKFVQLSEERGVKIKFYDNQQFIHKIIGEEAYLVTYDIPNLNESNSTDENIIKRYKYLELYFLIDRPFIYLRYLGFSEIPSFVSKDKALNRVNNLNQEYKHIKFTLFTKDTDEHKIEAIQIIPCFEEINFERISSFINQFIYEICMAYEENEISNAIAESFNKKKNYED